MVFINNLQNNEDQYFEKLGLPMIMCNYHKNSVYEFINLNNSNQNKLACSQCILLDRLNSEFLISIKDIFSKNPSAIIQNWPPMQDLWIYEQLMNIGVQVSEKNQQIELINRHFDKFKVDILKTIEEHQKKTLTHINSIEDNRKRVIDVYNQISCKDEIKNEFLKNIDNQSQLEIYLKQLISTQQNSSNLNQQKIQNALDQYTKYQKQLQFDNIQTLFEQFLLDLKSIDLLNPLLKRQQLQFQAQISDKNKDQDEENKLDLKVNKIMKLINNISNFCNQNFLNNLKDILMMNKQIFTQIDLNNLFLENNEPIQFEYLQQNQLQQIAYIVQQLGNYQINNQSDDRIQEQIYKSKLFEEQLMKIQYLLEEDNEKKIVEDAQLIEKKQENQYKNDVNEINLLESLKIIKSNFNNPYGVSLKRIGNNYSLIEKSGWYWSQVIIDSELIEERRYQIEIQTDLKSQQMIYVGLLPISLKDQRGEKSKLSLCLFGSGDGIDKIESGKHISELGFGQKTITFQICLKEHILRCLCIQNNMKNINSLYDWNKINSNEKYYFYIGIAGNNQIEVKQFKIIKQFEQW